AAHSAARAGAVDGADALGDAVHVGQGRAVLARVEDVPHHDGRLGADAGREDHGLHIAAGALAGGDPPAHQVAGPARHRDRAGLDDGVGLQAAVGTLAELVLVEGVLGRVGDVLLGEYLGRGLVGPGDGAGDHRAVAADDALAGAVVGAVGGHHHVVVGDVLGADPAVEEG